MSTTTTRKPGRWLWTAIACTLIAIAAGALVWMIRVTEPSPERVTAMKRGAILVEVVKVERGTFRPTISALGTVEAQQDLNLSPEVGGRVLELSPEFEPGSLVEAGAALLRLDPADYGLRLAQMQTELREAKAALQLEMGQQEVARREFSMAQQDIAPEAAALILREPQLESAKARVAAAEVSLSQAQLNLDRTQVTAPFAAQVLERSVSVGSQVSAGQSLGRLVGLERYWVIASLAVDQLPYLEVPRRTGELGSVARVRSRAVWPEGVLREGHVVGLKGALDRSSRLARVIIEVRDPLALEAENQGRPELILGSIMEVQIEGNPIADVVRIDRDLLRANQTIWVMEAGELRIVPVTIAFQDASHVYVSEGIGSEADVVVTSLSAVVDGLPLRTAGSEAEGEAQ